MATRVPWLRSPGPGRCPGRGLAAGRADAGRRAAGGGRPPVARPVSLVRREGGAAGGVGDRARRAPGRQRAAGTPRGARCRRALAGAAGVEVTTADGRRPPWPAGTFDRGARGRAVLGAGRLAATARSPLAQATLRSRRAGAAAGGSCSSRRWTWCDPGESWSTRPARRSSPRRPEWWRRCWPGAMTWAGLERVEPELPDAGGSVPGTSQLWPHRHLTDAMFLAVIRCRPGP